MNECVDGSCGVGIHTISTRPGDPDNNIGISASGGYGGIHVRFSTPGVNDYAVSYSIIYRGLGPDFNHAFEIVRTSGNHYYDEDESGSTYFYWVRNVSINGTVFDPVGPASATAKPSIEKVLQDLTGKIDSTKLAETLKGEIDRIETLSLAAARDRLAAQQSEGVLRTALTGLEAQLENVNALLYQEQLVRAEENDALVYQVNAATANTDAGLANVQQTIQAVSNLVDGIRSQYSVVLSAGGKNPAGETEYLVGGFGLINDGSLVQAGFDVDRFWVGRTNQQGIKPFIIDGGIVYMNSAVIKDVTLDKLVTSDGRSAIEGGKIRAELLEVGDILADNAVFRGTLDVKSSASGARMEIKNSAIKVYDANGKIRVQLGDLNA